MFFIVYDNDTIVIIMASPEFAAVHSKMGLKNY